MNLTPWDVIRRPRISEKSVYQQGSDNKYTFEVHPKATKVQVRDAIKRLFEVDVLSVRTMNHAGKERRTRYGVGRTPAWKKAIVTLAEGQQIEGV